MGEFNSVAEKIYSEESHYSTLYAFGDPAGVVRTDAVDAGFSV